MIGLSQYPYNIMSIVLRANELNTIIYKYLLEAGLAHTAYALFNEAALAQPLQEFRFDIRPAHLLSLLEKALVYAQIESHVTLVTLPRGRASTWSAGSPSACCERTPARWWSAPKRRRRNCCESWASRSTTASSAQTPPTTQPSPTATSTKLSTTPKETSTSKSSPKSAYPPTTPNGPSATSSRASPKLPSCSISPLPSNREDFEVDLLRYDALNDEIVIEQIFPFISQGKL
jgi:hypothetical protein